MPALLFDIGNVLVTFDFNRCAARLAEFSALTPHEIHEAIAPFKEPLESGRMPEGEFIERCMAALDFAGTPAQFRDIWCDIFTLNAPMAVTLAALPRKLPSHLFSNTNEPQVTCMKPDEAFYRTALRQFGLDPSQTFYVDDLAANIATGRRLGFQCFHYDPRRHSELHTALHAWILTLPETPALDGVDRPRTSA